MAEMAEEFFPCEYFTKDKSNFTKRFSPFPVLCCDFCPRLHLLNVCRGVWGEKLSQMCAIKVSNAPSTTNQR